VSGLAHQEKAAVMAGLGYPWAEVVKKPPNLGQGVEAAADFLLGEGGSKPALYFAYLFDAHRDTLSDAVLAKVWSRLPDDSKVGFLYMLYAASRGALLKRLLKSPPPKAVTSRSVSRSLRGRFDLGFYELTGSKLPPVDLGALEHVATTSLGYDRLRLLLKASVENLESPR
jgi:hypothetical protein